jgi:hypothetical protein
MKIDHSHAKSLVAGARSQGVDGTVLAKSASQYSKEKELNMIFASLKAKIKSKEMIVIVIENY